MGTRNDGDDSPPVDGRIEGQPAAATHRLREVPQPEPVDPDLLRRRRIRDAPAPQTRRRS